MKRIFILFVLLILSSSCALADEVLDVKLPPDYKIIVKNQDFPITLRPHLENGTFRVVNYQLFHNNKFEDNIIHKIQILNGSQILYESIEFDQNSKIYMNADDWVNENKNNTYEGINFDKYIIVHGTDKDYLLYIITYPNGSDHYPSYLLGYDKDNSKIILYSDGIPGDLGLSNPKNSNGEYELIDDKYMNITVFDGYFVYTIQYEISNNILKLLDKEYEIQRYSVYWYNEPHEVVIYSMPSISSNKYKIKIDEKSTVKIIGIRLTEDNRFVHVIVDGKEGWIEENDSQYIGVGSAIGGF